MNRCIALLQMVYTELVLTLKTRWKYKTSMASDVIVFTLTFLVVVLFSSFSKLHGLYQKTPGMLLTLIGFSLWTTGVTSMDIATQTIEFDSKVGILESEIQSQFSLSLLLLVRSFVSEFFVSAYIITLSLIVTVMYKVQSLLALRTIALILVFSCISNLGMFGLGAIFGAGSIHVKRIGQWATLMQTGMLIVSNVAVPLTNGFQEILPYGIGIEIIRRSVSSMPVSLFDLIKFMGINLLWLVVGVNLLERAIVRERRSGSFDYY